MLFARRKEATRQLVIDALSTRSDMTGAELSKATGRWVGGLYPVLMDMEQRGVITSRWETPEPRPNGPPRRRFYALPGDKPRG